jgi:hypothetical protein
MTTKYSAWVPVLSALVSIVADQDAPDAVLNDFMVVGFNFHIPDEQKRRSSQSSILSTLP